MLLLILQGCIQKGGGVAGTQHKQYYIHKQEDIVCSSQHYSFTTIHMAAAHIHVHNVMTLYEVSHP